MKEEMKAQKIIITGGATRIGAAIAEDLANDKNQITIHYNKSKKKAKQLKNVLEKRGSKIYYLIWKKRQQKILKKRNLHERFN